MVVAKRSNRLKPDSEGRVTRSELKALGVRPSKERGQNFLINPQVLERIVEFGNPSQQEHIVEIGPGLGALTRYLTSRERLTVIEIEPAFVTRLRQEFPDVSVIEGDFRKVDLTTIGVDLTIFGNIPYIYSTEIIFALIAQRSVVRRAVLLLQKEFAERVAAAPGNRSYGVISVMTQLFCDMRLGPIFGGHEFFPPAAVNSRVLEMTFLDAPREPCDPKWLRRVVDGAFLKRRKMIHNSLKAASFPGALVDAALNHLGIDPSRRAETLSLREFVALADSLRG